MSDRAQSVWVDGVAEAAPWTRDRGLLFGDGLFETMRLFDQRAPLWTWHRRRLESSAQRLALSLDMTLIEHQLERHMQVLADGVLRLTVTRGSGGQGYACPASSSQPRVITSWRPLPESGQELLRVTMLQQRIGSSSLLGGLKHLNRLEQVLLQQELDKQQEFDEALVQNEHGQVVEGIASNVFLVKNFVLHTPEIGHAGVLGVMRAWILERSRDLRVPTRVQPLDVDDFLLADEVFFCNSVRGIMPVGLLLGRQLQQGVITSRLKQDVDRVFAHA
ncbi:MAG: aminodeoxychorismate lyase [Pseudomonadales bacterium]|nr:aminodeoxychorismate lyase [Pseudomonadales bacterium]